MLQSGSLYHGTHRLNLSVIIAKLPNSFPISNEVMDAFPPVLFRFEMRAGPGAYCDIHTIAEPQVSAITEDIPCPDCGAPIPPFEGFSNARVVTSLYLRFILW